MDIQCHSGETSDRKEKGYWKLEAVSQGSPCYKVTKNLAELCLCPSILWKVELVNDEFGHLDKKISKQKMKKQPSLECL